MEATPPRGQTPSQTVGPFFAYALTPAQYGYDWTSIAGPDLADETTPGVPITIEGRIFDGAGQSITDAMLELWQADSAGLYPGQPGSNSRFSGFGRCGTGVLEGGSYRFRTIMPGASTPGEAPHLNLIVTMRGLLLHAFTRVYFPDEPANASDPILAAVPPERRATLLAAAIAPGIYRFDIHMQGPDETVFFDL